MFTINLQVAWLCVVCYLICPIRIVTGRRVYQLFHRENVENQWATQYRHTPLVKTGQKRIFVDKIGWTISHDSILNKTDDFQLLLNVNW